MPRIALFIDAENISYQYLPQILEEIPRYGELALQAVYADWQRPHLQKWQEIAEANAFKIRHQANPSKIKNSSDMKLILDAMDVLRWLQIDIFCLVTNDADYIPLCDKLHESNKQVIGIGNYHAAEGFIRACDRFIFVGRRDSLSRPPVRSLTPLSIQIPASLSQQPVSPGSTQQLDLQKLLSKAFARAPQDAQRWVRLSALGEVLSQVHVGFRANTYGHSSLTKLLHSMPHFIEFSGSAKSVRLRQNSLRQNDLETLQRLISDAFARVSCNADGWVTLSALGHALRQEHAGFQTGRYGYATLSKLLRSIPDIVELQSDGEFTTARLKK